MSVEWKAVPIATWPGPLTTTRRRHPFKVSKQTDWGTRSEHGVGWTDTTHLLERELRQLGARDVILQMAITERDQRNDGWIRADTRPSHPGVILSFASKYGPLSYPCDTFTDWQANVRAIALALEALRKVDRYGVTRRGEQYTGWKALPPAGATSENRPEIIQRGRELISKHGTVKAALFATHPDRGGDANDFHAVQAARSV